jgi:transposase
MDEVLERCCGLDVHRDSVVGCLRTPGKKELRTFRATTDGLREMARWLQEADCWDVAMESTGVYWKPVYNVLELAGIRAIVVNARHMKAVPGKKTDMKDAEWISDLFKHGLLRGSFVPDRPQRELRELVRLRSAYVRERTRDVNRLQKTLEGANIKLRGVAVSDVLGVSGRAMVEAMVAGDTDPEVIASKVKTKLKASTEDIIRAVDGLMGEHQRQLIRIQISHIDDLNRHIAELEAEIDQRMLPFQEMIDRIDAMPGFGKIGAQEVIAAIGTDMSQFPTEHHLSSWAKVCPSMNVSAGKRGPAATGQGNPDLRRTLIEAAWASTRRKEDNYFKSQYHHLKPRLGANKAIVAVAHSMLVTIYYLLKTGQPYRDLGGSYLDERNKETAIRQAVRRLEKLGQKVILVPAA